MGELSQAASALPSVRDLRGARGVVRAGTFSLSSKQTLRCAEGGVGGTYFRSKAHALRGAATRLRWARMQGVHQTMVMRCTRRRAQAPAHFQCLRCGACDALGWSGQGQARASPRAGGRACGCAARAALWQRLCHGGSPSGAPAAGRRRPAAVPPALLAARRGAPRARACPARSPACRGRRGGPHDEEAGRLFHCQHV